MSYFTPNELQPSEHTLQLIRTLARLFPVWNLPEREKMQHFN